MKTNLLFAAALLAASAMAQPASNVDISKVRLNGEQLHQLVQAKKNVKAQAKSIQKTGIAKESDGTSIMIGFNGNQANQVELRANNVQPKFKLAAQPKAFAENYDISSARKAKSSVSSGAYYRPYGGIYSGGETWTSYDEIVEMAADLGIADPSEYPNGIYLSYVTPWLYTQSLNDSARFDRVIGTTWTVNGTDMNQYLSDASRFPISEIYGTAFGTYYAPAISNARSGSTYFYGSDGDGSAQYAVVAGPDHSEGIVASSFGVYNMYDAEKVYTAWANTYAYGSRSFESSGWGGYVESDLTVIDLGYTGGGLVVDRIDAECISNTDCPVKGNVEDGHFIGATLVDIDMETGEPTYYRTYLAEGDAGVMKLYEYTGGDGAAAYSLHFTFVEEDEDGFSTEISPVLNGYVYLYLYNFKDENVDCGIYMAYNENADGDGNYDNQTHSYYDVWVDGVLQTDSYGDAGWYYDNRTDAAVNFYGYFNCFRDFMVGAKEVTVEIPAEGGWAVSSVDEDGTQYNDIDVASSFPIDDITIEECPDWLVDSEGNLLLQYDDSYFAESETSNVSNVLLFYAGAEALPEGETGRQGDIVLRSNDQVDFIIHVVQGTPTESISKVQNDVVKSDVVYNLQGVKVSKSESELSAGVYVKNGKKFVK